MSIKKSIENMIEKIKCVVKTTLDKLKNKNEFFIMLVIILVGFGGFGLGRLSIMQTMKQPVRIEYTKETRAVTPQENNALIAGAFVGSKGGSKYHLPWCSGAQKIKEENKIWFKTTEEAKQKGYTPAGNCPGL